MTIAFRWFNFGEKYKSFFFLLSYAKQNVRNTYTVF